MSLHKLLKATVQSDASDLLLVEGSAPALRVNGRVVRVKADPLTGSAVKHLCYSVLSDEQRKHFENHKEIDFSLSIKEIARFRVNYFYQRGYVSGAFRKVPLSVPSFSSLGLPKVLGELTKYDTGLVILTGPTGSGKTTTLAALLDKVNTERRGHIVTLEDPIEFLHEHKKCIVSQREVGLDTDSFRNGLRYILRQDPDVCLLGEMRDIDEIRSALELAETGHLVFATLHTNSAPQAIQRILGAFPVGEKEAVAQQLSLVLQGVVGQRLLRGVSGNRRYAACEYLRMNSGVRSLVREGKVHQVYGQMQIGQEKSGMVTLNQSLAALVLTKKIDLRAAYQVSPDVGELDKLLNTRR